jgi:hypothetical protein
MKNLIKACIALAAFAAIFVVPSMASAARELTAPTGTRVPVNTNIIATNVEHGAETKTQTVMTTPLGKIECTTATITGKVLVNNGTQVLGTVETAEFRRTAGSATDTAHCTAPGGLGTVTVTPSHTSDNQGEGTPASLPWCIEAGAEDTFEVWGEKEGSCAKKVPLTFTLHSTLVGTCRYEREKPVIGTYTTHPADAIVTIKDQEFVKKPGAIGGGAFCPASGKLDMAFTLWKEVNGVETEAAYIDK